MHLIYAKHCAYIYALLPNFATILLSFSFSIFLINVNSEPQKGQVICSETHDLKVASLVPIMLNDL